MNASPTQPLQPAPKSAPKPRPEMGPPAPAPKLGDQTEQTKLETYQGPSPLQRLRVEPRSNPNPSAVTLRYLTGLYAGQKYEVAEWLGIAVPEVSHRASAEWQSSEADGILCASNFKRLGDETFGLTVQFWDSELDIAHLTQNLTAHLREISPKEATPPLLMFRQGSLVAKPVVFIDSDTRYSHPGFVKGGGTGYRLAEVTLNFKLLGGKGSPNALGAAHTSTPLQDWRKTQNDSDREQQALRVQREDLLEPCLGAEGSQQLKQLFEDKKFNDPTAIAKLTPDAFVQLAIGGLISKDLLNQPELQAKLKKDLSLIMAKAEDGVSAVNGETVTQFATALTTGIFTGLTPKLQSQAEVAFVDFRILSKAISEQKLSEEDEAFSTSTAGNRLRRLGHCGLDVRQIRSGGMAGVTKEDEGVLEELKKFFGSTPPPTPQQVKQKFDLKTEEQGRLLVNGSPYISKEQFLKVASELGSGIESYVLWNKLNPNPEKKP